MRCRMSGPYPISSRHRSYNCAFRIPRWVSAYLRNQESFEGVFVTGKSTVEGAIRFWVLSLLVREWVGVVGNWWEDCVCAIDAKLERICEIDANADSSNDEGTWLGVDVEAVGWLGRDEMTDDLWFIGSNVCVCGGLFDDVIPSYCDQHDEIMIRSIQYDSVTYHHSSPFFHHKWCQWHRITCSRVNIGISSIMIIGVFLLKYSPKTSQFKLNLWISTLQEKH